MSKSSDVIISLQMVSSLFLLFICGQKKTFMDLPLVLIKKIITHVKIIVCCRTITVKKHVWKTFQIQGIDIYVSFR